MRCPKCGYVSFDGQEACPRCGKGWPRPPERAAMTLASASTLEVGPREGEKLERFYGPREDTGFTRLRGVRVSSPGGDGKPPGGEKAPGAGPSAEELTQEKLDTMWGEALARKPGEGAAPGVEAAPPSPPAEEALQESGDARIGPAAGGPAAPPGAAPAPPSAPPEGAPRETGQAPPAPAADAPPPPPAAEGGKGEEAKKEERGGLLAPEGGGAGEEHEGGKGSAALTPAFSMRFIAAAVDLAVLFLFLGVFALGTHLILRPAGRVEGWAVFWGLNFVVFLLMTFLYTVFLLGGRGQTVGQMLFGLGVVEEGGTPLGYGRAALRFLGSVIAWAPLGLGLLWAAWDKRGRGFQDRLARTAVVRVR